MRKADRIVYVVLFFAGLYIIKASIPLGYRSSGRMGPGFFPFWIGLLLSFLSIISLIIEFISKDEKTQNVNEKFAWKKEIILMLKVILSATVAILITKITGLLIALGLLSAYIGKLFGIKEWYKLLLLGIFIPSLLYLLFVYTFNVPIPKGIFNFKGVIF